MLQVSAVVISIRISLYYVFGNFRGMVQPITRNLVLRKHDGSTPSCGIIQPIAVAVLKMFAMTNKDDGTLHPHTIYHFCKL